MGLVLPSPRRSSLSPLIQPGIQISHKVRRRSHSRLRGLTRMPEHTHEVSRHSLDVSMQNYTPLLTISGDFTEPSDSEQRRLGRGLIAVAGVVEDRRADGARGKEETDGAHRQCCARPRIELVCLLLIADIQSFSIQSELLVAATRFGPLVRARGKRGRISAEIFAITRTRNAQLHLAIVRISLLHSATGFVTICAQAAVEHIGLLEALAGLDSA